MAWMLLDYLLSLDLYKFALTAAKSACAAVGSYFLKRVWRSIVPESVSGKGCIIKACIRPAGQYRGLCLICYSKAKKKVTAGEVTWKRLEELGLAAPDISDPFDDAYSKATEVRDV